MIEWNTGLTNHKSIRMANVLAETADFRVSFMAK